MSDLTREQIEQCTYPIGDCVCRAAEPSCKDGGQCGVGGYCVDCPKRAAEQKANERAAQAEAKNIALTKAAENLKECLDRAEAEREALRLYVNAQPEPV